MIGAEPPLAREGAKGLKGQVTICASYIHVDECQDYQHYIDKQN